MSDGNRDYPFKGSHAWSRKTSGKNITLKQVHIMHVPHLRRRWFKFLQRSSCSQKSYVIDWQYMLEAASTTTVFCSSSVYVPVDDALSMKGWDSPTRPPCLSWGPPPLVEFLSGNNTCVLKPRIQRLLQAAIVRVYCKKETSHASVYSITLQL